MNFLRVEKKINESSSLMIRFGYRANVIYIEILKRTGTVYGLIWIIAI